jgi:hypothetical protein
MTAATTRSRKARDPEPESITDEAVTGDVVEKSTYDDVLITPPRRKSWVIGSSPERIEQAEQLAEVEGGGRPRYDGTEEKTHWRRFHQRRFQFAEQLRFEALFLRTVARAADGGDQNLLTLLGGTQGTVGQRFSQVAGLQDDTGQFIVMVMNILASVPDFVGEALAASLHVHPNDLEWFLDQYERGYSPEDNCWGPTDEEIEQMLDILVAQNYLNMRRFFVAWTSGKARQVQALEQMARNKG